LQRIDSRHDLQRGKLACSILFALSPERCSLLFLKMKYIFSSLRESSHIAISYKTELHRNEQMSIVCCEVNIFGISFKIKERQQLSSSCNKDDLNFIDNQILTFKINNQALRYLLK
jgi:hypothetical protein